VLLNQSKRLTGLTIEQLRNELPFPISQLSERFLPADSSSYASQQSRFRESDVEIRNLLQDCDSFDDNDDQEGQKSEDDEDEEE
jgi:hypothetical protein